MVGVGRALAGSLAGLVAVLAAVSTASGLATGAWAVGLGCWGVLAGGVRLGHARAGGEHLGPADLVTLGRATLACAVAALVADPAAGHTGLLVAVAAVALALDAVDGRVARTTRTETRFGARFDGEADAFLILVLSVHVAAAHGAWVLTIGVARYAFGAAGLALPWLRGALPPRQWRKLVAAVQGVVLVTAAARVLPEGVMAAALGVALLLLAESFGRDVLWLWRHGRPTAGSAHAGATMARLPTT